MAVLTPEDCAAARSPGRLLRRVAKLATAYVETRFEQSGHDLNFSQWIAIKVVRDGVVTNAGELARELGMTSGATTRLIDHLEKRDLLARERCGEDRRVVRLVSTDAGRAAVEAQSGIVVDAWNLLLADVDQAEVDALIATMTKLLVAAELITGDTAEESLEVAA